MKKYQKKGVLIIILAILIYFFGGGVVKEFFGYFYKNLFFDFYLNLIIPLILIIIGVRSFLNRTNEVFDFKSVIKMSKNEMVENDKIKTAGIYFILCAQKFLIAIALQLGGLFITFILTKKSLEYSYGGRSATKYLLYAERFGLFISIVVFTICIAAIIDIKKAGESLKS
jgi:hypothetical protein